MGIEEPADILIQCRTCGGFQIPDEWQVVYNSVQGEAVKSYELYCAVCKSWQTGVYLGKAKRTVI